jgi:hypothetical protein
MFNYVILAFTAVMVFVGQCCFAQDAAAQRREPSPEVEAIIQSLTPKEQQNFFSLNNKERREFLMKRLLNPRHADQGPSGFGKEPRKGFRYFETNNGGQTWTMHFAPLDNMSSRGGVDPEVFLGSDGKVWIYYFGSNNTRGDPARNQPDDTWRILLAKSIDNGRTFIEKGIVYQENQGLTDPFVVRLRDGSHRMYISRGASVLSAFSKDGTSFSVENGMRVEERKGGVPGALLMSGGTTIIFVCRRDGIYSSVSKNGLDFNDFKIALEAPEGKMICDPSPERIRDDLYLMAYKEKPEHVKGPQEDYVRIATSNDGIEWQKQKEVVGSGSVPALLILDELNWKIYVSGPPPHARPH